MSLAKKLNLKPGVKVRVMGERSGVDLDDISTDLNRDVLWKHLQKHGIQGARQVSIDEVWSAMRFRPQK